MQAAMQESIDKLATALGEGNFYGALLTMRHAAALGVQQSACGWRGGCTGGAARRGRERGLGGRAAMVPRGMMPRCTPLPLLRSLAAGVVQGWQELEAIAVSGFCTLLSAAGGAAAAGSVTAALREHDRLVGDLVDDPLLARLVHAQNGWLHEIAAAGLDHPIFEQQQQQQQQQGEGYSP